MRDTQPEELRSFAKLFSCLYVTSLTMVTVKEYISCRMKYRYGCVKEEKSNVYFGFVESLFLGSLFPCVVLVSLSYVYIRTGDICWKISGKKAQENDFAGIGFQPVFYLFFFLFPNNAWVEHNNWRCGCFCGGKCCFTVGWKVVGCLSGGRKGR